MSENITKKDFNVDGMHCPSCEMLIVDSLEEFEGIAKATASHKKGKVHVEYDESLLSTDMIKKIIKNEGYEVE